MWGLIYMFLNALGTFDYDHYIYPIITWDSYSFTIGVFITAFIVSSFFYSWFCSFADATLKRRGE